MKKTMKILGNIGGGIAIAILLVAFIICDDLGLVQLAKAMLGKEAQ